MPWPSVPIHNRPLLSRKTLRTTSPASDARQIERHERVARDLEQPSIQGRDENGPARILIDRVDAQRHAVDRRDGVRGARLKTKHAALCADPHVLLGVFEDREHVVMRDRDRRRHRDEPPVVEAHQAAPVGADPHVAAPAFPQHADIRIVDELGSGEWIAANAAIEPAQTGDRADPDGAIARFPYRSNAVVGPALG